MPERAGILCLGCISPLGLIRACFISDLIHIHIHFTGLWVH